MCRSWSSRFFSHICGLWLARGRRAPGHRRFEIARIRVSDQRVQHVDGEAVTGLRIVDAPLNHGTPGRAGRECEQKDLRAARRLGEVNPEIAQIVKVRNELADRVALIPLLATERVGIGTTGRRVRLRRRTTRLRTSSPPIGWGGGQCACAAWAASMPTSGAGAISTRRSRAWTTSTRPSPGTTPLKATTSCEPFLPRDRAERVDPRRKRGRRGAMTTPTGNGDCADDPRLTARVATSARRPGYQRPGTVQPRAGGRGDPPCPGFVVDSEEHARARRRDGHGRAVADPAARAAQRPPHRRGVHRRAWSTPKHDQALESGWLGRRGRSPS